MPTKRPNRTRKGITKKREEVSSYGIIQQTLICYFLPKRLCRDTSSFVKHPIRESTSVLMSEASAGSAKEALEEDQREKPKKTFIPKAIRCVMCKEDEAPVHELFILPCSCSVCEKHAGFIKTFTNIGEVDCISCGSSMFIKFGVAFPPNLAG